MKTKSGLLNDAAKTFACILFLMTITNYHAQTNIANYTFASSTGTYTAITGGTVYTSAGYDDGVSAAITMGGTFPFGGTNFTTCFINTNGYIAFGVAPSSSNYTPLSVLGSSTGAIAAFAQDGGGSTVTGAAAEIRYLNTGTEFVVQYTDHANYYNRTVERLNFQIRLTYATGAINIVYGNCTNPGSVSTSNTAVQVGIRGNSVLYTSNVNNLYALNIPAGTTCNWANAVTGYSNASTLLFSGTANASVNIPAGLTYTWMPSTQAPVRTFAAPASITSSGATVSWTAPAGATQYNVRYRIPGTCTWTNWSGNPVSGTSVALTGLAASTTYQVQVQASSGTVNSIYSNILGTTATGDGYSTTGTFTTLSNVCTTPTAQPTALNLTSITSTTLSGAFTAASPAPGGYLVVRSTSSTLSAAPVDGTTYTAGTALGGGTVVQSGTGVTFTQTGLTGGTTYYYFVFSFNNASCSGGPKYFTTSPLTGNATTCLPIPASSAATAVSLTGFTANWAAATGATGYLLDVSTSSTFATFLSGYNGLSVGNVTSYALSGLTMNTTYYYRVRATGSGCTSSNSATQTIYIGYCQLSVVYSDPTGITNVSFNTISNTSAGDPAYTSFTAQSTTIQQGQSYNLSVSVNTDGDYTVKVKAWIDWNQNGTYETSEEYDLGAAANTTNTATSFSPLSVTVPPTALTGNTFMRIVAAEVSDFAPIACGTIYYGEAEDYSINVIAASNCSGTPVAGTSATNNSYAICNTAATRQLTLNGSVYSNGVSYQWKQSATPGGPYTNASGGSGATTLSYTTPGLTQNMYYVCESTCSFSGLSILSNETAVAYNSPSVTSTTPATVCGTTTASLQATVSGTPSWYNVSTGGSSLSSSSTYVTPVLSTTTNYWVEAAGSPSASVVGLTNVSASNGTFSSAGADYPIRLTTTQTGAIESFQFYPNGPGVYVFQLRISGATTQASGTTNASVTVSNLQYANLVTVTPADWLVPAGNYQITAITAPYSMGRFSSFTGTYPMTGYGISVTGSATSSTGTTNTSTYSTAFNIKFTTTCVSTPRVQVTATVNPAPALTLSNATVSNCAGQASTTTVTIATGAASYDTYSWSSGSNATGNAGSGWVLNPTASTTANLTSSSTSTGCVRITPVTITINAVPAGVTAGASSAAICPGASVNLTSAPGPSSYSYSQAFATAATPTGWASIIGSGDAVAISNTNLAGGTAREVKITGNTSSTANVTTIVYYGPINSTGMNNISVQWKNYLSHYSSTYNYSIAVVTSTDLSTWNSTSWGTSPVTGSMAASTQSTTISNSDVGSANLYIGFRISGLTFGANNWNIDDVTISSNTSYTYSWTSSPAGFTSSVQNPASVTPAGTSTYTVRVTNAAGCSVNANTSVTINTATPSNVAAATGMSLSAGDLLWNGNSGTAWSAASNWYEYNGTAFAVSSNTPASTRQVYVLPSSTANTCISSTNNVIVNAGSDAGGVFIGSGAILSLNPGQTLNVNGNWVNNGTFNPTATGIVRLTGTNAESIGGSATNTFTNLVIDKSASSVTLATPVSVTGTLTMLAGDINTSASELLTIGTSPVSPGSLDWTSGTINGPLKRFISGTASATQASGIFPVGNSSYNRYAQVNFNTDPVTGGFITAEYKPGICPIVYGGLPATINGLMITNYENEGYWEITPTGGNLNTTPYDLILRGNHLSTVTNLSRLRIIKSSNHTAWNDNPANDGDHSPASGSVSDFTIGAVAQTGFSWFNIGADNANPLPVTLTSFSANCGDHGVKVDWSTASESNSLQFIVEKSRDLSIWNTVSVQAAAGNSNHTIYYSSTDENPYGGNYYYRLIQTDYNGNQRIYDPVSVSCKNSGNSMTVFPNPSSGAFTVEISSTMNISNAAVSILDLSGKTAVVHHVVLHEGSNHLLFDEAGLQKGTYLVNLSSEMFKPVKIVIN